MRQSVKTFVNTSYQHKLVYAIIFIASLLPLISCTQDTEEIHEGSALLIPSATIDPTIYSVDGTIVDESILQIPDPTSLSIKVSSANGIYSGYWLTLAQYPLREPYRPGSYNVELFGGSDQREGFDMPYFAGSSAVVLQSGQTTNVTVNCTLANSVFRINFSDSFKQYFGSPSATLHSAGGGYFRVSTSEKRLLYLNPGSVSLILTLSMADGRSVEFVATTVDQTRPQNLYDFSIDLRNADAEVPEIVLSLDPRISSDDIVVPLTKDFLNAQPPILTPFGFIHDTPLTITEGISPQTPTGVDLTGSATTSLLLTTIAPSLTSNGWPTEIDLATASEAQLSKLRSLGLEMTKTNGRITKIDLTNTLAHLRSTDGVASFTILAADSQGFLAGPLTLSAHVNSVDLAVTSLSDAIVGINTARMTVICNGGELQKNLLIEASTTSGSWQPATITSITPIENNPGQWEILFTIPDPKSSSAKIRISYCDTEKLQQTIRFISPDYTTEVDPFAQVATLQFTSTNEATTQLVTATAKVHINGQPTQTLRRFPSLHRIIVGGLTPNATYTLRTTMFANPTADSDFSQPLTFQTESTPAVPNGGFEDVKTGIKYNNLPSGGRYSQNIVEIYNQQNYASYDQFIPKGWANVNAKTFCTAAKILNTWYLQPSSYSIMDCTEGAYAVCLQTTAWDINGTLIEPYRQTGLPYLHYSANIPTIAHRAAAKLFLGEYTFDPATATESYVEGIAFNSRPMALNGSYRFIPCISDQSDCGFVRIEILGEINGSEIVIASGTARLTVSTGYSAFSIPLSYDNFNIKASRLKIIISSSQHTGSIAEESRSIVTTDDPATATSLGGTLWIDNLTFTY